MAAEAFRNFLGTLQVKFMRSRLQWKWQSTCQERNMQDLGFVAITILFFAISIGYVHFCERIR